MPTWLNTRRIVLVLGFGAVLAAVIQVALDADLLVLLLALLSISCGLFGFWLFGVNNLAGWVCLMYTTGNVLIAFYAKTIFLQPLDSNLTGPLASFTIQAICCFAMLLALILTTWIGVGRPLMPPITDLTTLRFVSNWCLVIGFAFQILQTVLGRQGDSSFGGLNVLGGLVYLGIIARTALVMQRSDGRRILDPILIVAIGACTLSGVLSTGKSETSIPSLCFIATILFFKGKLPWRYVAAVTAGVLLFVTIAPIMLTFRYMGLRNMPLDREIETFEYMLPSLLNRDELALLAGQHSQMKSVNYNYYGNHEGQLILGRFSSIQQIDPIIGAVQMRGPIGGDVIVDGFRASIPKTLDPDKPTAAQGFTVIKSLGIYRGGGPRPTVPLAAVVFAAYGIWGVILIPFATFLVYLLLLKKLCWDIRGNIFAIFILACQVSAIHSAELQHFAEYVFRDLPLLAAICLIMQKVAYYLTVRKREFAN